MREDDPLNGAKVALPPQNYTWDAERLLWVHSRSKQPYAEMARRSLPGLMKIGERPAVSRSGRCMAWSGPTRCVAAGATVTSHSWKVMIWGRWGRGP